MERLPAMALGELLYQARLPFWRRLLDASGALLLAVICSNILITQWGTLNWPQVAIFGLGVTISPIEIAHVLVERVRFFENAIVAHNLWLGTRVLKYESVSNLFGDQKESEISIQFAQQEHSVRISKSTGDLARVRSIIEGKCRLGSQGRH